MNPAHVATARALLLGRAQARFTDARRGQVAVTPFCLAADGSPLLCATAGAPVSVALAGGTGAPTLVLRGRAATAPPDDASCLRFRRHHDPDRVAASPIRLVEPLALLCTGGARHPVDYPSVIADVLFDSFTEARMVTHMNDDHVDALRDYCAHAGVACRRRPPRMAGIDRHGFFVVADAGPVRFEFAAPCATARDVRKALVALAGAARGGAQRDV